MWLASKEKNLQHVKYHMLKYKAGCVIKVPVNLLFPAL